MKPIENLGELVEDANAVILITEKDGNITLTFSQNIGELEVLDILSLVTSEFYLVAADNEGKLH